VSNVRCSWWSREVERPGKFQKLFCAAPGFIFSLEWVTHISSGGGGNYIKYANAMKGWFSICRDNAKNTLYLEMSSNRTLKTGSMLLLFTRFPVSGAAEGIRNWSSTALTDPVPYLNCHWIVTNQSWCNLGLSSSRKVSKVDVKNLEWWEHTL
ncbi:hypothetical protein U0070_006410, partial [Myodes glareolus]